MFIHFLTTICLQLCIISNSIVFHTSELPIIKPLFNSPYSPQSPTTSQSFQFSSHPIFTRFPNKQTINQHKFQIHLMRFSLASLHHLQNSLFILHLTLSLFIPHSHSCSSSCTPPPNPAASSACLPAASPPADRTPPSSPTFHPSPSPTFPTIISCSKLDISNDVYTFISGAFSATFAPCFDSSLRLSYTPGRIAFSSSGVGRCSSLRETPRESLLLLHRGLLELHVQLLLFRLQTRGHLVYR